MHIRRLLLPLIVLFFCTICGARVCYAQETNPAEPSKSIERSIEDRIEHNTVNSPTFEPNNDREAKSKHFYEHAFLDNYVVVPKSRVTEFLRRYGLLKVSSTSEDKVSDSRVAFRPFLHWTRWANQKLRFGPAFAFMLMSVGLSWFFLAKQLSSAAIEYSAHYWRCCITGVLFTTFSISIIRFVLMTEVGWPLAIVFTGLLQLLLLLGMAISGSVIGKTVVFYLKLGKWPIFNKYGAYMRWVELAIGVLILALLLQLGSPFGLPRLGSRLVALLAIVGIGGIYRVFRRAQTRTE